MQRVHFIAIGGAAMHNLAIAVSRKNNFFVTGSDVNISDQTAEELKKYDLLPEQKGWFPDKITKTLAAVVRANEVTDDNPELLRAEELGLKIFTYPEYIYQQTRSKTRLIISGNSERKMVAAIIVYVLKQLKLSADYLISATFDGLEFPVQLSYDARIAVIEGEDCETRINGCKPRFHYYKPHIAVLTGIDVPVEQDDTRIAEYIGQFAEFIELMEFQGRLIYFGEDSIVNSLTENLRRDLVAFKYGTPEYEIRDGVCFIKTRKEYTRVALKGGEKLQDIEAARLACRQIGVTDDQFYRVVADFEGI
ncbi:MAG: Mur ligase domain-containing protein [Paludibacter sp.]|nr:Mur ligase domain-containing protein [Paludibacter sp.]